MNQLESFFWGIIAALSALIVEIIFYIIILFFMGETTASLSQSFTFPEFIAVFAFIEEAFKYIVIFKRLRLPSVKKIGLVNVFFIGFGFFLFESVLIVSTKTLPSLWPLLEIAIVHIGTAILIGGILIIKNTSKIVTNFVYAMAASLFFHIAYNFLSMDRHSTYNYAVFFILGSLIIVNLGIFLHLKRLTSKTNPE